MQSQAFLAKKRKGFGLLFIRFTTFYAIDANRNRAGEGQHFTSFQPHFLFSDISDLTCKRASVPAGHYHLQLRFILLVIKALLFEKYVNAVSLFGKKYMNMAVCYFEIAGNDWQVK